MLISIRHVTRYTYAQPVGYAIQSVRLTPASFTGQRVLDWKVIMPGFGPVLQFKDGFGVLPRRIGEDHLASRQFPKALVQFGIGAQKGGVLDGVDIA